MQVMLVNPTARRMFDWEEQNVVGKNVLHHLPPALTVKLTRPLHQILKGETTPTNESQQHNLENEAQSERGEYRITLNEPTQHTVRVLLTKVLDQYRENIKGIAMTVQDITKEVELNAAKSQFISNISHELRTPLFNIKSFIETLFEYGEDLSETEKQEFLQTANHETDRLTRLVNDVLDLSRLESAKIYHLDPVDLVQPIEQTLRTYQLNAKDKRIELSQEIQRDLPLVWGHYDLLLQVLTNLVGNSLKFTSSGGKVVIRAYEIKPQFFSERKVRLEISDTGIGIDLEDQESIFDRFFRVENRVHTLEGTGLGLSIVRNIIEKHNSRVCLVSEVGVGTTFWFDLTIYQEEDSVEIPSLSSQD